MKRFALISLFLLVNLTAGAKRCEAVVPDFSKAMRVFEFAVGKFRNDFEQDDGTTVVVVSQGQFAEMNYQFHFRRTFYLKNGTEFEEFWVITHDVERRRFIATRFQSASKKPRPVVFEGTWTAEEKRLDFETKDGEKLASPSSLNFDLGEKVDS